MAYLPSFSGIDQALDPDAEERARLERSGQVQGAPLAASGGSAEPGAPSPGYTQTNFASGKRILEKAQGAQLGVDLAGDVEKQAAKAQEDVGSARSKLQTGVNESVAQFNYAPDSLAATTASGKGPEFDKLTSLINSPDPYAKSKNLTPDYIAAPNVRDVTGLATQAGLQGALQKNMQGGQNYTRGMAALDATIYQKDPRFLDRISDVAGKANAANVAANKFQNYDEDYEGSAKQIKKKGQTDFTTIKDKAKQDLGDVVTGIRKSGAEAGKAGQAYSGGLYGTFTDKKNVNAMRDTATMAISGVEGIENLSQKEKDQIIDSLISYTQLMQPKDTYDVTKGSDEIYNKGQIAQFDRIQKLLGGSDILESGQGATTDINMGGIIKSAQTRATNKIAAKAEAAETKRILGERKEKEKSLPQKDSLILDPVDMTPAERRAFDKYNEDQKNKPKPKASPESDKPKTNTGSISLPTAEELRESEESLAPPKKKKK